MSGPAQQSTNTVIIPPGEGRKSYSPVSLAWYIENLRLEDEDTLTSVVGPSILRIKTEPTVDSFGVGDATFTPSDGAVMHLSLIHI